MFGWDICVDRVYSRGLHVTSFNTVCTKLRVLMWPKLKCHSIHTSSVSLLCCVHFSHLDSLCLVSRRCWNPGSEGSTSFWSGVCAVLRLGVGASPHMFNITSINVANCTLIHKWNFHPNVWTIITRVIKLAFGSDLPHRLGLNSNGERTHENLAPPTSPYHTLDCGTTHKNFACYHAWVQKLLSIRSERVFSLVSSCFCFSTCSA